jgi:ubiquinone/menaquinone biosynthesis C-methylase UbiE
MPAGANEAELGKLQEKILGEVGGAFSCVLGVLGDRLGLYKAMDGAGQLTPTELALRTGTSERLMREWLNANAAAGWVKYHGPSETFELTAEQAMVLARDDNPANLMGLMEVAASLSGSHLGTLAQTFRSGRGLSYAEQPVGVVRGIARATATEWEALLVQVWLPALGDWLEEELNHGVKVADVGCGFGATTLMMARSYPNSTFVGFDRHEMSVIQARKIAKDNALEGNVSFQVSTAKNFPGANYSLITMMDSLHDFGDPLGAAQHVYDVLADGGIWLIVEHLTDDKLDGNLKNPLARILYSFSATVCVPNALTQEGGCSWGACAGEAKIRAVVEAAGPFREFRRIAESPRHMVFAARK